MAKHDKGHRDSGGHKEVKVEATAAPVPDDAKVGGRSAAGEVFRSFISKFVRRGLHAIGMTPDRIHIAMAGMTEGQRELLKTALEVTPHLAAFIIAKLPLGLFAGFKNPDEAAETFSRILEEFFEEVEDAVGSYGGVENIPEDVLTKAADKALKGIPKLEQRKLRSPIEILNALFEKDDAKRKEWNDWFRSLAAEDKERLKEFMPYLDSLEELEGLLKIDPDDRMAHLDFLKNHHQGFRAAQAAKKFGKGVEDFLGAAKDKLKTFDKDVLRPAADDLSWSMEARSFATTFGWVLMALSPFAAIVAWFLTKSPSTVGYTLLSVGGLGFAAYILGALLRKKRAMSSGFSEGMNWLRLPFLAIGWVARWGTNEIGAVKRLISLAFTVPFLVVLIASLMNAPKVVFYTSLSSIIFAVFVLTVILVDTVLAFAVARAIGAITKKQDLFSGEAVTMIREWASSTVAWYVVIFMTFMLIPWVTPMAVGIIAASSLFFAAQRLAGWFHSKAGRYAAYGAIVVLLGLIVTREFSPRADMLAEQYAHKYLGGDIGLAGIEDRALLKELQDERNAIRKRARKKCGQEYCSDADALRDAEILRRRKELVKGTYWDARNGTPIPPETVPMLLSKEEAETMLRELEDDNAPE